MQNHKIFIIFYLLGIFIISAQEINQFDADGERHGVWKKHYEGTEVLRYEGTFFHGKEVGTFKFYKNVDGKPILAATKVFNRSDHSANVTFYNDSGKLISEGELNGKIYVGTWKYYQNNGKDVLTLEHYNEHGELHGERFVYYDNGELAESQIYNSGKLEGVCKWYSEEGVVLKEFVYVKGELHGPAKYFNPKGDLITEGQYKKGKKTGVWKFYEQGLLVKEKDFTYKPKYVKVNGKYKKTPQ
ncbi:toxin-antitoxin system YwqK family antitoxin [Aestuariivivens sediminicola]|uniref:toxin-antitoxin system YwqK family antitoxin n=1 Tax=Aestuariivivens sediminicola TaxID=2913560 RepID=UPI001F577E9F|nr:toxin-antitoxin system YwqK family antitoxin [Aestuariivivens sediminicola]